MVQRRGKEGQFFLFDNGLGLTREWFVADVQATVSESGQQLLPPGKE